MIVKRPSFLFILAGLSFAAALISSAHADQEKAGYGWPSQYDFFVPYGTKDGGPVYARPGRKGASLTLTCQEATGILKMRGYKDIAELNCTGAIYRFKVTRAEARFLIDLNSRTGDIVKRQQL